MSPVIRQILLSCWLSGALGLVFVWLTVITQHTSAMYGTPAFHMSDWLPIPLIEDPGASD